MHFIREHIVFLRRKGSLRGSQRVLQERRQRLSRFEIVYIHVPVIYCLLFFKGEFNGFNSMD